MTRITAELSRTNYFAIPGLRQEEAPATSAEEIIDKVCRACGYSRDAFFMVNRNRRRVAARYIAMVAIRRITGLSLKDVGQLFGKDHTTVIHAQEAVAAGMETQDALYMDLAARLLIREGIDIQKASVRISKQHNRLTPQRTGNLLNCGSGQVEGASLIPVDSIGIAAKSRS